ncbi:cysteine-rich receptor-like protein kinase 42 [Jatropha curcas]|uniref:cysteine-rich receptor-like protein kinase 42 n=1 Tax=Jatropha curcas TaxID=180498 RepID=UPI0018949805|nr:cysteine-rich receptor-like protein kinase 42 [Jatropha curcas]
MKSKTCNNNIMFTLLLAITWSSFMEFKFVVSDSGIKLLNKGCSNYNVSSLSKFNSNLNDTFRSLRTQLNAGNHFAIAKQLEGADGVFAMVQCRDYMSTAECIACFRAASIEVRSCSPGNGGRVVYDGCFVRYERNDFYGETTRDANREYCENQTTSLTAAFQTTADSLLRDLQIATPRINGFFTASKRDIVGVSNASVYGIAQCVQTIDMSGCLACMQVAYANIQRCLPKTDGRAVDSGCFMRYSNKPFFADNQTINLEPFLKTGSSSKKTALIAGVAGGVGLILLIIGLFAWFKLSRRKAAAGGLVS